MMSEETFSASSNTMRTTLVHVQDPNSNSNPNPIPNPNPAKKKRNLPGTPDPDAEVIALSPESLMATNRFICEICNKGFKRDQNLQLHRRGHNLPWKLKQRTNKDQVRKKAYVCPEKSCVHHDPCRALGDLTGIKKHYSRKHGEKKWKCEKCSKKYAVQSDWKAHSKICGTREYKCDCGTLFSRKDSFITHRAFCDALAEESARITTVPTALSNLRSDHLTNAQASRIPQIFPGFHSEFGGSGSEPLGNYYTEADHGHKMRLPLWLDQANSSAFSTGANSACTMPDLVQQAMEVFGSPSQAQWLNYRYPETSFTSANNLSVPALPTHGLKQEQEENKGDLSHSVISSLYLSNQNPQGEPTHMSATALLQKAAQMGSTRINDNAATFNSNNHNNPFGLMSSNLSRNNNNNSSSNIVEFQKFFKQAENLNELVNLEASNSTNLGGEYLLNDSNNSFVIVTGTKNLDHMVMPVGKETNNRPPSIMGNQLNSSSNNKNQMGLTRDFLGVGDDSRNRPFLQQDLAEFNAMGSATNLQSHYSGQHYC